MPKFRNDYYPVDKAWLPAGSAASLPLDPANLRAAFKRVYRLAYGKPNKLPIKVNPKGSYVVHTCWLPGRGKLTWLLQGQISWSNLVHSISHRAQEQKAQRPENRGHGLSHALNELELVREVVMKGWVGKQLVKPKVVVPKVKPPVQVVRAQKVDKAIRRAEQTITQLERKLKAKRRQLAKLRKRQAYYARPSPALHSLPGGVGSQ